MFIPDLRNSLTPGTSGMEVSESAPLKRTQDTTDSEVERESKRARIATEEEQESGADEETGTEKMEDEEEVEDEEEAEEVDDEEEGAEEDQEENNHETTPTKQRDEQKSKKSESWGDSSRPNKGGLKCILRCNFQVKQTGGLISVEAYYLGGSSGKDGLNQLVQYMRNQLSQPFA